MKQVTHPTRVLITGGAGFIGSRLALRLVKTGYAVTVLDNLSAQVHTDQPEDSYLYTSLDERVHFIRGDVTSRTALVGALRNQDIVVHLAAETGTGQSMYEVERYCHVNIGGTSLLLDVLANERFPVRKLLLASSRAVYGEGKYWSSEEGAVYPQHRTASDMQKGDFDVKWSGGTQPLLPVATDESSRLHPSSVYGITKQTQEQLVMTVCPAIGIIPVVFRYQNVYGPGQSLSNPYTGILSIFSNLVMNRKPINIFEDGAESRDFVFIDDVVDATVLGLESDAANNETFNVGSGVPVSVLRVAETLSRHIGIEVPVQVTGAFRVGDIRHNFACLTKIAGRLGFSPRYTFEEGIGLFCEWAVGLGAVESRYEASLAEMGKRGLLK